MERVMSALPIDDRMSVLWALDPRHVQDELLGLLKRRGVPAEKPLVEDNEEEKQKGRPPAAGEAGPL